MADSVDWEYLLKTACRNSMGNSNLFVLIYLLISCNSFELQTFFIVNLHQSNLFYITDVKLKSIKKECTINREILIIPIDIYLFKVNNGNTRAMREICSTLTIKTPERLLLILNRFTYCSGISIVDFEQVNADWNSFKHLILCISAYRYILNFSKWYQNFIFVDQLESYGFLIMNNLTKVCSRTLKLSQCL